MSKPKLRARMARLSIDEKIRILERLRDRDKVIAAAGLRKDAKQNKEQEANVKRS